MGRENQETVGSLYRQRGAILKGREKEEIMEEVPDWRFDGGGRRQKQEQGEKQWEYFPSLSAGGVRGDLGDRSRTVSLQRGDISGGERER